MAFYTNKTADLEKIVTDEFLATSKSYNFWLMEIFQKFCFFGETPFSKTL
jgi:hypothetical protein